ncbi:MAG: PAS domain-containing protein [Ferruginibacter sp.]
MNNKYKILHLEEIATEAERVAKELETHNILFEHKVVDTEVKYLDALKEFNPDVILCNYSLSSFYSEEAIRILKSQKLKIPFIIITAMINEDVAKAMVKNGITDYILKERLNRLPHAVLNAAEKYRHEMDRVSLIDELYEREFLSNEVLNYLSEKILSATRVAGIGIWEFLMKELKFSADEIVLSQFGLNNVNFHGTYTEFLKRVHPDDRDILRAELRGYIEEGSDFTIEYRIIRDDSSIHFIKAIGVVERDEVGNAIRILGTNHNVTYEKEAKLKILESESRMAEAQRIAKVGSWETDLTTMNVIWSQETCRILGIDECTLNTSHEKFLEFVHPEDKEKVNRAFTESYKTPLDNMIEHRIITPDGKLKSVEERWRIINNSHGIGKAVGTIQDITERKHADEAITESEKKYRSLIESSMDAILLTVKSGQILAANAAACELFGRSEEELCKVNRGDIVDENDPQLPFLLKERDEKGRAKGELTFIGKGGRIFQGEISSVVFKDANGELRTSVNIRDISERKRAEQKIYNSEQRYRTLFEQNIAGFYESTLDGTIINCNNAFAKMLKYDSVEELLETNASQLYFSLEDRSEFIKTVAGQKKIYNYEGILKCKDGSALHFLENLSVHIHHLTGIEYFDGIIINITTRKQAELELKESNERFLNVSKATFDVVWDWNIKAQHLYLGDGYEELFGYHIDNHEGSFSSWADRIHPEDKERVINSINFTVTNADASTVWSEQYRYLRANGDIAYILNRAIILKNGSESYRMIGAMQDVSKLKEKEIAITELNNNLKKHAEELALSNEELERFAYVTSHDLQEPLRMVTSFLQLLQKKYDSQLDETAQKYINFAVDGANRMKSLIMDLLEYSRISSIAVEHTKIDLNAVLINTKRALRTAIEESGARILAPDLPDVTGNEIQLIQLFQNLISNAIKYRGSEKPLIEIGFKQSISELEFHIRDNGIGIDEKYYEKIFIMFQRLHNRKEYDGTGIGLAICKKIVELHQGKIWVESSEKGSVFNFTLKK